MAIELHIQKVGEPPESARAVPVATASVFDQFWAPAATQLGLRWIPLFRTGLPVTFADIPYIVDDLLKLKNKFTSQAIAPENVLPRIETLLTELHNIAKEPNLDLYIG